MPNTHRRRRRDSTVELIRVSVVSASAVCIEFATSSRRLTTKIWKVNMLRIYPVQLSRVELCRRCVRARWLSWPSLQFCSLYVIGAENWKLGHDWRLVRSHRRHDGTRLRCRQIVQTRRDSRQLVANSIHTADATQLDSWVASASAVCVGLYWIGISWTRPTEFINWWSRDQSSLLIPN